MFTALQKIAACGWLDKYEADPKFLMTGMLRQNEAARPLPAGVATYLALPLSPVVAVVVAGNAGLTQQE